MPRPILYFVRHGETDGNKRKVMQGMVNGSENQLNEEGRHQAKIAAVKLFESLKPALLALLDRIHKLQRDYPSDWKQRLSPKEKIVILVSPLNRADDTYAEFPAYLVSQLGEDAAELLFVESGCVLVQEIDFGDIDGKSESDVSADPDKRAALQAYRALNPLATGKGGEHFLGLAIDRAEKLLDYINEHFPNQIVVMFSHGTLGTAVRVRLGDAELVDAEGWIDQRSKSLPNAKPFDIVPSRLRRWVDLGLADLYRRHGPDPSDLTIEWAESDPDECI